MSESTSSSTGSTKGKEDSLGELLWKNETVHDVTLQANDGIKVTGVRSALAVKSPVFMAMLFGKFSEAKEDVVKINEYTGRILMIVVEYIHTDELQLDQAKHKDLEELILDRLETLASVATAAKFFELPGLTSQVQYLLSKLLEFSPQIAFAVLDALLRKGPAVPDQLLDFAWFHVRVSCDLVEDSKAVAFLSQETMEKILKDEKTFMNEFHLFTLLQSWHESDPDGRLEAAKHMSHRIQMGKIDPPNLFCKVKPSGLFSPDALLEACELQALKMSKEYPGSFQEPRQMPKWTTFAVDATRGFATMECPALNSGKYEWTLEHTVTGTGAYNVGFGVISTEASLDNNRPLGENKGSWIFTTDGDIYRDGEEGDEAGPSVHAGEQVIVTLNLQKHFGTLVARVKKYDGSSTEFDAIANLLSHLPNSAAGFVPVIDFWNDCGFRLVNFNKCCEP